MQQVEMYRNVDRRSYKKMFETLTIYYANKCEKKRKRKKSTNYFDQNHFNYFDFDDNNKNTNTEMRETIK